MDIGEETGSMPDSLCTCRDLRPKRLKPESVEEAKDRLVERIVDETEGAISRIFENEGHYLLKNACGTAFNASKRSVSTQVRKQAIREALEQVLKELR